MEDTGENETERKTNEHDYNEIAGGPFDFRGIEGGHFQ